MHTSQDWQEHTERVIACRACPRLVNWREQVSREKRRAFQAEEYWGKPVPGFGDNHARILIIGLAPGAHGSNRTGRMFTGDASGDFLFPALYAAGFASQPNAQHRQDGLTLKSVFISAICRCAPPQNRPVRDEIRNCAPFLSEEYKSFINLAGIVALGRLAFDESVKLVQKQMGSLAQPKLVFVHNSLTVLGEGVPWLLASYHPSRQNTQTGRLTAEMFALVWEKARKMLEM